LSALFKDPLLSDVSTDVTAEEVDTLIALETGTAFEIRVERAALEPLSE
jgi:hypothetical protein